MRLLGFVGGDGYGEEYVGYLEREGVNVEGIVRKEELQTGRALITVDR